MAFVRVYSKPKQLISGCLLVVAPCVWSQHDRELSSLNPQIYASTTTVASDICVGLDCAQTETPSENHTELRLKENNVMVRLINTAPQASGNLGASWLIQGNDNLNGGSNSFRFLAKAFATEIYDYNGSDWIRELHTDIRYSDGETPAYDCNIGDTGGLTEEPVLTDTPIPIGNPTITVSPDFITQEYSCSSIPWYEEELVMRLGASTRDFITLGEGSEPLPLQSTGVVSVGAAASPRKITNVAPPESSTELLSMASLSLLPNEVAELTALRAAIQLAESRLAALESADADSDNVANGEDAFPLISLGGRTDTDGDGRPDNCDTACQATGMTADPDDDNDGVADTADGFPLISIGTLKDTDGDGRPDNCDTACQATGMTADPDDDNDLIADTQDDFPTDPTEATDTDSDGLGDNADQCDSTPATDAGSINASGCGPSERDSDSDGTNDALDAFPNDPDETSDSDGDGYGDNAEIEAGTDPNDANDSPLQSGLPIWLLYEATQ